MRSFPVNYVRISVKAALCQTPGKRKVVICKLVVLLLACNLDMQNGSRPTSQ